jgi:hypothetical protein
MLHDFTGSGRREVSPDELCRVEDTYGERFETREENGKPYLVLN